jgi:hypothetical protein
VTVLFEAGAIINMFSSSSIKDAGVTLEAIEIGNEADLYVNNHARFSNYTVEQYVSECVLIFDFVGQLGVSLLTRCRFARWNELTAMIAFTEPVKFWGASFAKSSHSTSGFSPQAIFKEGNFSVPAPGSLISTHVCFLTQTRCPFMLIDSFVA